MEESNLERGREVKVMSALGSGSKKESAALLDSAAACASHMDCVY